MTTLLTQQKTDIICPLTQYRLVEIQGVDAAKYLQGQLTCDVLKLKMGQSTLTAHCDPKGKMNSLFRLICVVENRFFALFHQEQLTHALAQLKKYAVFSKVSFIEQDWTILGLAGEKGLARAKNLNAEFCIDITTAQPRKILLNPTALSVEATACTQQWDLLDIQDGIPNLHTATLNQFIPQAMNMQSIEQAISFTKGCYLGQETVARAKYRGANKRALFIFTAKTEQTVEIGTALETKLENGWRETGIITSAVNFDENLWLQAVLNTPIESEQVFRLPNSEILLQHQPLPYEL